MEQSHFTTRRGFIAAAGFGMVSLYFLWAGYGAAPLFPDAHTDADAAEAQHGGGHGGGHGSAGEGMATEEFKRLAEQFVEQYKLADGSVAPRRREAAGEPQDAGGHGHAHQDAHAPSASEAAHEEEEEAPLDVYLASFQFGYSPAVLRLEPNVPYRFRMMALDVAHGASLQLGSGSRIVRLRPGVLVEQEVTFLQPGEYLLYCTVYCGLAHDHMQGKIIVAAAGEQQ